MRHLIKIFSITSVILFSIFTVVANEPVSNSTANHTTPKHEESFNAGKMIIEHVTDAHEWHIANFVDGSPPTRRRQTELYEILN